MMEVKFSYTHSLHRLIILSACAFLSLFTMAQKDSVIIGELYNGQRKANYVNEEGKALKYIRFDEKGIIHDVSIIENIKFTVWRKLRFYFRGIPWKAVFALNNEARYEIAQMFPPEFKVKQTIINVCNADSSILLSFRKDKFEGGKLLNLQCFRYDRKSKLPPAVIYQNNKEIRYESGEKIYEGLKEKGDLLHDKKARMRSKEYEKSGPWRLHHKKLEKVVKRKGQTKSEFKKWGMIARVKKLNEFKVINGSRHQLYKRKNPIYRLMHKRRQLNDDTPQFFYRRTRKDELPVHRYKNYQVG